MSEPNDNDKMADGLCSESDRKHFVAAVINENVFSASEKSGKCVNLSFASRVQSVSGESVRGETVNRGQQNMTATGQQPQQSKKVLDAKLMKNKSAPNPGQGVVGPQPQGSLGIATAHGVGPVSVSTCGGVVVSAPTNISQPRALVESEKKMIVPPQKVMNVVLQKTTVSASAGNGPKMQQKKDLKSASAANVDMAAIKKSVSEPEQPQQPQQYNQEKQQDTDDSPSAKKKRCSDRYDSSESSDSGVATLSCTDSSTASSDASDPGSPYSPVSLGEDANQSSTKANMPPQMLSITRQSHRVHHSHQSQHQMTATASTTTPPHQNPTNTTAATHHHYQQSQMQHPTTTTVQHQWPWNVSSSNNNTISNHNNNSSTNNNNLVANASNKTSNSSSVNSVLSGNSNANAKSKRNSTANSSDINGTAKKVRSSAASADRLQPQAGLTAAASKRLKAQQEESPSQTKITGFFKSQMKPLKTPLKGDLNGLGRPATLDAQSCLVSASTGALEKYFNANGNKTLPKVVFFGAKDEKDLNCQRNRAIAIKKDFYDLPPLTQTMPPSLKKIERKPGAKVAQVAPISRKTAVTQQLKSPKKHIAIAPRTAESSSTPSQKPPTPNAFQIDQTKISQPTVLLTAIRIPPHTVASPQQTVATSGAMSQAGATKAPLTPTKMGSMLQIPVVPNLVQIPNLLATNGPNLLMNNGQLARMGNGGQYFLNGTVLKLQQISNGHSVASNTTNGVLAVDSATLQGNILVKQPTAISQPLPMVAPSTPQKAPALAMQQSMMSQSSVNGNGCHQAFIAATNQRLPTQPVLMATSSGWYVLNQHTTDTISNNIPHQATLTTMVCKSTRTAVTPLANGVSPPVPPLATLTSKLEPTPLPGPKVSTPYTPKTPTPIPTEPKDNAPCPITLIESAKPLTVECPPLGLPVEAVCPIPTEGKIKLESPKIVKDLFKSLQSPKIIGVDVVENKADIALAATSPKCAISPILSQPKTIRFPVPSGCEAGYRFGPKGIKRPDGVCFWDKCPAKYDTNSKLLDHLQTQHVNSQTGPFSCLWLGCKVRGRESCSRRWLERHVLSHGGTKPFKCIVDGCGLRLGSQLALQKHVNGHFNATETKDNPNKRTSDPPIPKQLRKNVKKLRYRRQPFSARMFDFFDAGIMEGLQHRLMVTGSLTTGAKGSLTFHGRSMARRKGPCGINELYVKWSPSEIIPDEWVPESIDALTKTITIQSMKYQERIALNKYLQVRSSSSDESIKTVSKMQIFPQAVANLSTLFGESGSAVTTTASLLSSSSSTSGGRKQSRKPLKKNPVEPS